MGLTVKNVYMYRIEGPRPDFASTMSDDEADIMMQHAGYWAALMAEGKAIVFTPVPDPSGDWGMAVVLAPDAAAVEAFALFDPAVQSGLMRHSILELPYAITPDRIADAGSRF